MEAVLRAAMNLIPSNQKGWVDGIHETGGNGRIVLDYDMKIAEPLNAPSGAGEVDLWPAYRALAGRPLLVERGSLSDILSQTTLERMMREVPTAEAVTIADVGHAPSLDEAEGLTAIERMLARCR